MRSQVRTKRHLGEKFQPVSDRSSHIPTMWHVQDPLGIANAMGDANRAQLGDLIGRVGGSEFMSLTLDRPIARENNVYVVGS